MFSEPCGTEEDTLLERGRYTIDKNQIILPPWLGFEPFHETHRANLLRKDLSYYSQFNCKEAQSDVYLWLDEDKRWYYLQSRTKKREYI